MTFSSLEDCMSEFGSGFAQFLAICLLEELIVRVV